MGLETLAITAAKGVAVGAGIGSAVSSARAGRAQSSSIRRQGEFNAQVYEQQGEMVQRQKKIEEYQYNRRAAKLRGAIVSRTAGGGFLLSGSPLAMLVDSEAQLKFDQAIGQYNLDVQRNYARSGAAYYRQESENQARRARASGYTNAFTSIMNTGSTAFRYLPSSKGAV